MKKMEDLAQKREQVLAMAKEFAWKPVSLGEKLATAPGELAWRQTIARAGTKELVRLKLALNAVLDRELVDDWKRFFDELERCRAA